MVRFATGFTISDRAGNCEILASGGDLSTADEAEHGIVLEPLLRYIVGVMALRLEHEAITIVVPQSVRPRWWSNLMRTQMGTLLRLSLPLETGVVITDVPYHLDGEGR